MKSKQSFGKQSQPARSVYIDLETAGNSSPAVDRPPFSGEGSPLKSESEIVRDSNVEVAFHNKGRRARRREINEARGARSVVVPKEDVVIDILPLEKLNLSCRKIATSKPATKKKHPRSRFCCRKTVQQSNSNFYGSTGDFGWVSLGSEKFSSGHDGCNALNGNNGSCTNTDDLECVICREPTQENQNPRVRNRRTRFYWLNNNREDPINSPICFGCVADLCAHTWVDRTLAIGRVQHPMTRAIHAISSQLVIPYMTPPNNNIIRERVRVSDGVAQRGMREADVVFPHPRLPRAMRPELPDRQRRVNPDARVVRLDANRRGHEQLRLARENQEAEALLAARAPPREEIPRPERGDYPFLAGYDRRWPALPDPVPRRGEIIEEDPQPLRFHRAFIGPIRPPMELPNRPVHPAIPAAAVPAAPGINLGGVINGDLLADPAPREIPRNAPVVAPLAPGLPVEPIVPPVLPPAGRGVAAPPLGLPAPREVALFHPVVPLRPGPPGPRGDLGLELVREPPAEEPVEDVNGRFYKKKMGIYTESSWFALFPLIFYRRKFLVLIVLLLCLLGHTKVFNKFRVVVLDLFEDSVSCDMNSPAYNVSIPFGNQLFPSHIVYEPSQAPTASPSASPSYYTPPTEEMTCEYKPSAAHEIWMKFRIIFITLLVLEVVIFLHNLCTLFLQLKRVTKGMIGFPAYLKYGVPYCFSSAAPVDGYSGTIDYYVYVNLAEEIYRTVRAGSKVHGDLNRFIMNDCNSLLKPDDVVDPMVMLFTARVVLQRIQIERADEPAISSAMVRNYVS